MFDFNNDVPYPNRSSTLGLLFLQYHFLRGDMIYIYQMVYNNINGFNLLDFFTSSTYSITRGHTHKFFKPHVISCQSSNFLTIRSIDAGTIYQNVWLKLALLIVSKICLMNTSLCKCFVIDWLIMFFALLFFWSRIRSLILQALYAFMS